MGNPFYSRQNASVDLRALSTYLGVMLGRLVRQCQTFEARLESPKLDEDHEELLHSVGIQHSEMGINEVQEGSIEAFMRANYVEAVRHTVQGNFRSAFNHFYFLIQTQVLAHHKNLHRTDADVTMQPSDFTAILGAANTIGRAWLASSACGFLGQDSPSREFFLNKRQGEVYWPHGPVFLLENFGAMNDLLLLETIGNRCFENSMEGYTRRACRHIVARSPIELYPAGVPPDPSIHPSLQKAFYGHLLESLGIDKLMLHFPGMYALKTQNADPVSHMVEARTLEDLMSLRFDAPVLTDDVTVFAEEIPRGAARGYLTGKGMVEERRLTDEGIAAVRSICSIVPYIAVSYHAGKYPLLTAELNLPARPQLAAGWLA